MSLKQLNAADKTVSEILCFAQQLIDVAKRAARDGDSFDSVERDIWKKVKQMGHMALELFIRLQGEG